MRKMSEDDFNGMVPFFDQMAQTNWLSYVHDALKGWSGPWQGKSICDVGCGTGRILMRGIGEAGKLTGVDLSPEMIKMAKQNLGNNATLLVGDAYELPFDADTFDLTLSTCVMFLLPEPEKGIAEMIRITKPGGKVTMLNPALKMSIEEAEKYADSYDIEGFERETLMKWSNISTRRHRYEPDQLSALLKEHGVRSIEHHEVLDGLALVTVGHL